MADAQDTPSPPGPLQLLAAWLPDQRWYAGKGRTPVLRALGGFSLEDPDGAARIEVLAVADESGREPVVYQVPLTFRSAPLAGAEAALVGRTFRPDVGTLWAYDGPHDQAFVAQLLALLQGQAQALAGPEGTAPDPSVRWHAVDAAVVTLASSSVLRGEQSNTSVVCEVVDAGGAPAEPVIIKVFRTLHAGENPDVVVQSALTEAGSTQVPHTVGYVSAEWADPRSGDRVRGHVAFAQRYLPGVEDAWRVALRAATDDADFSTAARELGEATAHIHRSLATALGTQAATDDVKTQLVDVVLRRYATAAADHPPVAAYDEQIRAAIDGLATRPWPDLQRVHGDYHLGQVLRTTTGWVAVDFEGEPLRPLSERVRPDLALRDVAGMLRSFDYAGGSVELSVTGASRRRWVEACRSAFLQGYAAVTDVDLNEEGPLLRALELDKALYELSYETRNRPAWVGIPAAAVRRLVATGPVQQGAVARKGVS